MFALLLRFSIGLHFLFIAPISFSLRFSLFSPLRLLFIFLYYSYLYLLGTLVPLLTPTASCCWETEWTQDLFLSAHSCIDP